MSNRGLTKDGFESTEEINIIDRPVELNKEQLEQSIKDFIDEHSAVYQDEYRLKKKNLEKILTFFTTQQLKTERTTWRYE